MCRDWGDTGDIYLFIGLHKWSFVIYTCLLDGGECCDVDVCALVQVNASRGEGGMCFF